MSSSADTGSSTAFVGIGGGIATKHQDLAASIVFVVAYAVVIPLAIWRLSHPETRSLVIIRPAIFLVVQVLAYILREVFMLAGFILICEPIPDFSRVIGKHQPGIYDEHHIQKRILRILQVALVVALVLAIVAATKIGANMSADDIQSVKDFRIANAALVIGGIGGSIVVAMSFILHDITSKGTALLIVQCVFILAAAIYKLVVALHPAQPFSVAGKIVFYIFTPACSWVAAVLYFIPNLQVLFPPHDSKVPTSDVDLPSWQPQPQPYAANGPGKEPSSGYMA